MKIQLLYTRRSWPIVNDDVAELGVWYDQVGKDGELLEAPKDPVAWAKNWNEMKPFGAVARVVPVGVPDGHHSESD